MNKATVYCSSTRYGYREKKANTDAEFFLNTAAVRTEKYSYLNAAWRVCTLFF